MQEAGAWSWTRGEKAGRRGSRGAQELSACASTRRRGLTRVCLRTRRTASSWSACERAMTRARFPTVSDPASLRLGLEAFQAPMRNCARIGSGACMQSSGWQERTIFVLPRTACRHENQTVSSARQRGPSTAHPAQLSPCSTGTPPTARPSPPSPTHLLKAAEVVAERLELIFEPPLLDVGLMQRSLQARHALMRRREARPLLLLLLFSLAQLLRQRGGPLRQILPGSTTPPSDASSELIFSFFGLRRPSQSTPEHVPPCGDAAHA